MELYWLLRLPKLNNLFSVLGIIMFLFFLMVLIAFVNEPGSIKNEHKNILRIAAVLAVMSFTCFLIAVFFPTQQDLAIMMGWDAINSDSVGEVIDILKDRLVK